MPGDPAAAMRAMGRRGDNAFPAGKPMDANVQKTARHAPHNKGCDGPKVKGHPPPCRFASHEFRVLFLPPSGERPECGKPVSGMQGCFLTAPSLRAWADQSRGSSRGFSYQNTPRLRASSQVSTSRSPSLSRSISSTRSCLTPSTPLTACGCQSGRKGLSR